MHTRLARLLVRNDAHRRRQWKMDRHCIRSAAQVIFSGDVNQVREVHPLPVTIRLRVQSPLPHPVLETTHTLLQLCQLLPVA